MPAAAMLSQHFAKAATDLLAQDGSLASFFLVTDNYAEALLRMIQAGNNVYPDLRLFLHPKHNRARYARDGMASKPAEGSPASPPALWSNPPPLMEFDVFSDPWPYLSHGNRPANGIPNA